MEKEKNIMVMIINYYLKVTIKKGKEYYNGKLIFEGEYINVKRNGWGKIIFWRFIFKWKKWIGNIYTHDRKIIHELKKGTGLFSEYNYNGDLIFEGQYKEGLKNGKGKDYYTQGQLKFEGENLFD